jgi:dUTP pyrophosphatase
MENKTMNEFYTTSSLYDNPESLVVNTFVANQNNQVKIVSGKHGVPTRGTKDSAGFDLKADLIESITIKPNTTAMVSTGIKLELPTNMCALVLPRSGLAYKNNITVANSPGLIDSDYRGEVRILLRNEGTEPFRVDDGDRIAQLLIVPFVSPSFISVDELGHSERNMGGFGSTGNR